VFYDAVHSIHLENIPWTAKYVYDDDVIRYISIENRKHKGEEAILENSAPLSLLVHSSVPFGIENMNTEPEAVLLIMMQHLVKIFPMLENIAPSDTNLVFWKDSQVSTGLKWNDSKSAVFKLSSSHLESPSLLGFAGDYFTQSNFEGCLTSSRDIALSIHQTLCGDK
jgi:renalase